MSWYKWLWTHFGRRPWTYIYRDLYRNIEWFIQAQWFFTGILIYWWLGWKGVLCFWIFYTLGYINGHFFWGRDIIDNQQGD